MHPRSIPAFLDQAFPKVSDVDATVHNFAIINRLCSTPALL